MICPSFRNLAVSLFIFAALIGWLGITGKAQTAASLDTGFAPMLTQSGGSARGTLRQPDGKLLVWGDFTLIDGTARNQLVRFNTDGTVDTGFTPSPSLQGPFGVLAVSPSGRLIILGRERLIRLNADGSLDTGFTAPVPVNGSIQTAVVDANERIVIGGSFQLFGSNPTFSFLARLNPDGSHDPTFTARPDGTVFTARTDSQGRYLIAGEFTGINFTPRRRVARINGDGTLDTSFNPGDGPNQYVRTLQLDSTGKIFITGIFSTVAGVARQQIARLNSNGTLDTGYVPTNLQLGSGDIFASAVDAADRLYLGGGVFNFDTGTRQNIARLDATGALDSGFNPGADGSVSGLASDAGNGIVVTGQFLNLGGSPRNGLGRIRLDGALDATFAPVLKNFGQAASLAIDANGRILVAGTFDGVGNTSRTGLARLLPDGTLDASFNPVITGNNLFNRKTGKSYSVFLVGSVVIDRLGRIVIGGSFGAVNGVGRRGIARLNTDGSLDTTFDPGNGANGMVLDIKCDASNRVILGGVFNTIDTAARPGLARLNENGSLDTGFAPTVEGVPFIRSIAIDTAGRLVVAGDFSGMNGIPGTRIVRLMPSGASDTTFSSGLTSFPIVNRVLIEPNSGKYLLAGNFNVENKPVTRLNTDGSTDSTFNFQITTYVMAQASFIDRSNRFLIGGTFDAYYGDPFQKIARFSLNGTPDPSFNANPGPGGRYSYNASVFAITQDSAGRILIGGNFETYDGVPRGGIARLLGDTACAFTVSPTAPNFPASGGTTTLTVTTPTGCPWTVAGTLPDWLSASVLNGTGTGTVQFTATSNPTTTARSASFTVAGQTISVTQDASVTVNASVSLVTTSAVIVPTTCGAQGYANDYLVTAVATNTGATTLYNLGFEVVELREANGTPPSVPFRLVSADGATCGSGGLVGSRQTVATQIAPGASVTFQFRIALPSIRRFRFLVTAVAATAPPLNLFERIRRNSILMRSPSRTQTPVDTSRYFRR
jgi:uncharacterized delta-60 repeat protein